MSMRSFTPFPTLVTDRLVLRQLVDTDADAFLALRSDQLVGQYIDRAAQRNIEEAQAHILKLNNGLAANDSINWVITEPETDELIGTICLWGFSTDETTAELGYELFPTYQGQGLMSEAVRSVLAYGFEQLGLAHIEAYTHRDNAASIKLLERHLFSPHPTRTDSDNAHHVIYTLDRDNWLGA
jgi:[ribosomal protein S5]-alanine N-acetyltransferase